MRFGEKCRKYGTNITSRAEHRKEENWSADNCEHLEHGLGDGRVTHMHARMYAHTRMHTHKKIDKTEIQIL